MAERKADARRLGGCSAVVAACAAVCLLVAAAGWPHPADGARVLAFETVASKSHWYFMRAVLRALSDTGRHQVTVYTPFPDGGGDNYTEVNTLSEYHVLLGVHMDISLVRPFGQTSFMVPFLGNMSRITCDLMGRLLGDVDGVAPSPYDLFVTEPLTSECVSHVARRLGVPLVYTVPTPLVPWIEAAVFGHYANPAHVPHLFSAYAVPDTFARRLHNAAMHLYTVYAHFRHAAAAEPRPYDREPPVRPSLVFVNTHHVTEPSRPVPVSRVDVGGIHLKTPAEPLPADILEFIEDSPHGVIFFTFGTVVAFSTLPDHIQKAFKDALAEVPQRVLLKYEGEMLDKPKNVMTRKWFPQRDILLHPNVKLFISHGGISGVYETVDAGVPVLGFPMFYDQPRNIENLVDAGMAISLDLFTVNKDTLLNSINKIVDDDTYSQNAKIASERFKDRPMSPAESVVYWTEYVIRHKGAPHLKSPALDLTWYQYFLLDVIGFVLLIVSIVFFITYKTLKCIYNCIFKSSSKSKSE